jgi:hypothetical protein
MSSPVRQDVVAVWYDAANHGLWTQFGTERIDGLKQIAQRLAADGWRITSTTALSWRTDPAEAAGSSPRQIVTELALFISKDD